MPHRFSLASIDRQLDKDAEKEPGPRARQRIPLCVDGAVRRHFTAADRRQAIEKVRTAHIIEECLCARCQAFNTRDWSKEFERSLVQRTGR